VLPLRRQAAASILQLQGWGFRNPASVFRETGNNESEPTFIDAIDSQCKQFQIHPGDNRLSNRPVVEPGVDLELANIIAYAQHIKQYIIVGAAHKCADSQKQERTEPLLKSLVAISHTILHAATASRKAQGKLKESSRIGARLTRAYGARFQEPRQPPRP
jgi:hypothetical protein